MVRRFDGYVARYLGDGILNYFGYPQGHEDERAARAALPTMSAVDDLPAPDGEKLQARIGIATGLVVVGEGVSEEAAVSEEPPNLAARLQTVAEPIRVNVTTPARSYMTMNREELNQ